MPEYCEVVLQEILAGVGGLRIHRVLYEVLQGFSIAVMMNVTKWYCVRLVRALGFEDLQGVVSGG
jgi:hypothetical protein